MPMITKFGRVGIYLEEPPRVNSRNPWPRGPARPREILDLLFLYYNKAYGHQTCYSGDLL